MDDIKKYIDKHKGKRAIVCGTGPSLNDINFNKLSDDIIIFACNQAVTALDKCNYFCIADNAIICMDFFKHGANICNEFICFGFNDADHLMSNNNNSSIRNKFKELIKNKSKFFERGGVKFNKTGPLFRGPKGEDVIHVTSHFAYLLGIREILLAGVDLTVDNGTYCEPTVYKNKVNWDGVAHYNNNELLSNSFNLWKKLKEEIKDVKFLNASPRGRLNEIFDSVEIETLY
tara:strand:+ start:779 stop:1471 length:693 start_codon:yes stop_codon:yes gene_type:complete